MVEAQIIIFGMVQGVGYRYFVLRQAHAFELNGYVKNLPDGSVEVCVEGQRDIIEQFKSILEQGPSFASVERVEIKYLEYQAKYNKFSVEY